MTDSPTTEAEMDEQEQHAYSRQTRAIARQFLERWSPGQHTRPHGEVLNLVAMAMLFGEQRGLEHGAEIANEAFTRLAEAVQP